MKFERVPTYSVATLESRARQLLTDSFGRQLKVPIEVELIVERLPGVFFDYWPGLRDNHCTEGMVCRDTVTGELCVFIDERLADQSPNRYRMTVAEELAHLQLHGELIKQITSPEDFVELQRHDKWEEMDRNAKRFAAAVLMPSDFVLDFARRLYPELVAVAGFNNPSAILGTMAARLADDFEVSSQAMSIRLGEYPAKVRDKVIYSMQEKLDYI